MFILYCKQAKKAKKLSSY